MLMRPEVTSSKRFWILATLYLGLSFTGLWLTTGGYAALIFAFIILPFYLLLALIISLICWRSTQVRFSQVLLLIVACMYLLALLFNFGDGGFYGITCDTKNLIQKLFDRSACGGIWVGYAGYWPILFTYAVSLVVFVGDVVQRQARVRAGARSGARSGA